jgi:hypothetical protein
MKCIIHSLRGKIRINSLTEAYEIRHLVRCNPTGYDFCRFARVIDDHSAVVRSKDSLLCENRAEKCLGVRPLEPAVSKACG